MSNLKKIRLFEAESIAQGLPSSQAAAQYSNNGQATHMQLVNVMRMVEIDMFFFFFGTEVVNQGGYEQAAQYLYRTKNLEIQQRYLPHNAALYIDKVIEQDRGLKKIVTFGQDCQFDEQGQMVDQAYVLKVWDFQQLTSETCKCSVIDRACRPLRRTDGRHHLYAGL